MIFSLSILPLASLFDPDDPAEGSLDPLGTYLISESIASRIGSPGIRERQRNLRFLTLCCIGWEVMASIDPDLKPGDPSATLEQAFEWLVLEALVEGEGKEGSPELKTLPGIIKARDCVERKVHLNADRYLRMPSVFGFFGVYRTLAEYVGLAISKSEEAPILGPEGLRLLEVWRKEQSLPGFGRVGKGDGEREYSALADCLEETWCAGQAKPNVEAWGFIQKYMQPIRLGGPKESVELERIIREPGQREEDGNRREILKALDEPWAIALLKVGAPEMERSFHEKLSRQAGNGLKLLLEAALAYEGFIRPLHDLFDDLLFFLTPHSRLISIQDATEGIVGISKRLSVLKEKYVVAAKVLKNNGDLGLRFEKQFADIQLDKQPVQFLQSLIEHHEGIQKNKPPAGKAPWLDRQDNKIGVRPLFRRKEGASKDQGYVYFYRTRPLYDLLRASRGEYGEA